MFWNRLRADRCEVALIQASNSNTPRARLFARIVLNPADNTFSLDGVRRAQGQGWTRPGAVASMLRASMPGCAADKHHRFDIAPTQVIVTLTDGKVLTLLGTVVPKELDQVTSNKGRRP